MTPPISLGQSLEYNFTFLSKLKPILALNLSVGAKTSNWLSESGKKSTSSAAVTTNGNSVMSEIFSRPLISNGFVSLLVDISHWPDICQPSELRGLLVFHEPIVPASAEGLVSVPMLRVAWTEVLTGMQTSWHSSQARLAVRVMGPDGTLVPMVRGTRSMVSPS